MPTKETKSIELKNYGSIKRSQAVGQGHMTPYVPGYVHKGNRNYEECDIREKFQMDFDLLETDIHELFENARGIKGHSWETTR